MFEIITGIVSGIVSGTGMGGGTILILLLTLFLGLNQHTAQATNLVFFIPTSIVAIIINFKNKLIDLKLGILIIIFGVIGSVIGASIAIRLNVESLRKYFGVFLLMIAICEIYSMIMSYISKKNRNNKTM